MAYLEKPLDEDSWRDALEKLQKRFPGVARKRVADALRCAGGHAGRAATALRGTGAYGAILSSSAAENSYSSSASADSGGGPLLHPRPATPSGPRPPTQPDFGGGLISPPRALSRGAPRVASVEDEEGKGSPSATVTMSKTEVVMLRDTVRILEAALAAVWSECRKQVSEELRTAFEAEFEAKREKLDHEKRAFHEEKESYFERQEQLESERASENMRLSERLVDAQRTARMEAEQSVALASEIAACREKFRVASAERDAAEARSLQLREELQAMSLATAEDAEDLEAARLELGRSVTNCATTRDEFSRLQEELKEAAAQAQQLRKTQEHAGVEAATEGIQTKQLVLQLRRQVDESRADNELAEQRIAVSRSTMDAVVGKCECLRGEMQRVQDETNTEIVQFREEASAAFEIEREAHLASSELANAESSEQHKLLTARCLEAFAERDEVRRDRDELEVLVATLRSECAEARAQALPPAPVYRVCSVVEEVDIDKEDDAKVAAVAQDPTAHSPSPARSPLRSPVLSPMMAPNAAQRSSNSSPVICDRLPPLSDRSALSGLSGSDKNAPVHDKTGGKGWSMLRGSIVMARRPTLLEHFDDDGTGSRPFGIVPCLATVLGGATASDCGSRNNSRRPSVRSYDGSDDCSRRPSVCMSMASFQSDQEDVFDEDERCRSSLLYAGGLRGSTRASKMVTDALNDFLSENNGEPTVVPDEENPPWELPAWLKKSSSKAKAPAKKKKPPKSSGSSDCSGFSDVSDAAGGKSSRASSKDSSGSGFSDVSGGSAKDSS